MQSQTAALNSRLPTLVGRFSIASACLAQELTDGRGSGASLALELHHRRPSANTAPADG